MNDAQPTEHMHQLLANLEQALRDLDAGNLDLDGLDKASKQAQSLYERLVVLRHKAREGHRPTAPMERAVSFSMEQLAGTLYHSLRDKIMTLADDVIVYPAHGAGSACGKNMSKETVSTIGNQKQFNYALRANMTEAEFVKEVTDGLLSWLWRQSPWHTKRQEE